MRRSLYTIVILCLFWTPACSPDPTDCGSDCSEPEPTDPETSDPSTTQDPSGDEEEEEETLPEQSVPICLTECDTATDCDLYNGQYTVYNADHYNCIEGGCVWQGCNSDDECKELQADYKCHPLPFTELKSCVPGCSVTSDCSLVAAGTLYDTDNYECTDGACIFTGCNTDSECQEAQGSSFICVDPFNIGQKSCYQSCSSPSNCGNVDAGPAYDADNYKCENELCIYSGCISDEECSDTFTGMVCIE